MTKEMPPGGTRICHKCGAACHCQPGGPKPQKPRPKKTKMAYHKPCPMVPSLLGLQAQLEDCPLHFQLEDGQAVPFDTLTHRSAQDIHFVKNQSAFYLTKPGVYLINWQVSFTGSNISPSVGFAIQIDGELRHQFALPVSVGFISGSALLEVNRRSRLSLINNSGDVVALSNVLPTASITITRAGCVCPPAGGAYPSNPGSQREV